MKTFTSSRQTEQRVNEVNLHRPEFPPMLNFCDEDLFNCESLEFIDDLFIFKFVNELFVINSQGLKVFSISPLDLRRLFGGHRKKYNAFMKEELAKFLAKEKK